MSQYMPGIQASSQRVIWACLLATLLLAAAAYWPGLSGGFLFDDYPNIVNNEALHMERLGTAELSRASLSSPSSQLKRPLASLTFAFNHLATGLDPFWMKLTNLIIHLLNGLLVFLLSARLIRLADKRIPQAQLMAVLVTAAWLLLPINLTAVLYVVQRMESLANLFVLLGLLVYLIGRERMRAGQQSFLLCVMSLIVPTILGALAKEPAVMLPFYAFCMEGVIFKFHTKSDGGRDKKIVALFAAVLFVPLAIGLTWLLPGLLNPATWASRDFTLATRLLSEARIVTGYILWTLIPNPDWLSFYHDDLAPSKGFFSPWTTFAAMLLLAVMGGLVWLLRDRMPLVSLGLALYLGAHLLTGTILPLELVYEHRNYFASFGLLLCVMSLLALPRDAPLAILHYTLLGIFLFASTATTALTAYSWGDPLRLAEELAARNPRSPRAQYELGATYVVYSRYQPDSPFVTLARIQLESAAALPNSSILPEQALIMMSTRTRMEVKDQWWDQLTHKLAEKKPSVEDVGALLSLARCSYQHDCGLPKQQMLRAFLAALDHSDPSPHLLGGYAEYAWNQLGDPNLAESMARAAVTTAPTEPAHRIRLIRILLARGQTEQAITALAELEPLNLQGRLSPEIAELSALVREAD